MVVVGFLLFVDFDHLASGEWGVHAGISAAPAGIVLGYHDMTIPITTIMILPVSCYYASCSLGDWLRYCLSSVNV